MIDAFAAPDIDISALIALYALFHAECLLIY